MVGMNPVVMDEAVVGAESIVAALAFVKAGAVIAPRSLAVGSPARVLRDLTDAEIALKSQGTAICQRLALEAPERLRPATPLTAPEPDRRRAEAPAYDPKVLQRLRATAL
jgi:phenylacetic acid degradation protein